MVTPLKSSMLPSLPEFARSSPQTEEKKPHVSRNATVSSPAPTSPIIYMEDVGSGREFRATQSSDIPPFTTEMNGDEHDAPFVATHVQSNNPDMASQDSILLGIMRGLASNGGPFDDDLADTVPNPKNSGSSPGEKGMFHLT